MKKINILLFGAVIFCLAGNHSVYAENPQETKDRDYSTRQGFGARNIIGTDDRTKVTDTTVFPYSSVVRVEIPTARGYMLGSGAVVGKNTILTAGHVAADFKRSTGKSVVIPGKNGSYQPYGTFTIKAAYNETYLDIGVLILEPNQKGQGIGDVVPRMTVRQTGAMNDWVSVPGYGGDKHGELWTASGKIIDQDAYRWYYDADSVPGNSGAPLLNRNNEIIGVHVYGFRDCNGATKTTGSAWNFVQQYIDAAPPVQEAVPPVLSGIANKEIHVGDSFDKMAGIKAIDQIDGDITSRIQVSGTVDTQKAGTYVLTYTVTNSKGKTASATRSITVKAVTSQPNPDPDASAWSPDKTYNGGEIVSYKGKKYRAKWWTKNNAPDSSQAWEQITEPNSDNSVDYVPGKAYTGGTIVNYNGKKYKAKWWTNSKPGSDSSWAAI